MRFDEVLAVLLGWVGLEIEVSTHGANGAEPVTALDAQGRLRRGDSFGTESVNPGSVLFVLDDRAGTQVATFRLHERSFIHGCWYSNYGEVLEIRSGVILILVSPAPTQPNAR
jgi:hypothetical protein